MEKDVFSIQSGENFRAIDQAWKILQPSGKWYIGKNTIGMQGESFSDIELDHIKRFIPNYFP
ncbi:MAG: hypothetical protein P0S95_07460 [Rhabdochlamydiaceae bacterium]|nr:hypothetical protein [Candidatus Amphrikana amoebophyrae]